MLNEVLNYLNNYFFEYTNGSKNYSYSVEVTFTEPATITGDFTDTFVAGEYILIEGTRLNDGVYKVTANNDTSLTIDDTLDLDILTEGTVTACFTKCYIPRELLSLIAEIKTYNSEVTDGVASEKQGQRSITYGSDGSSGWKNAFYERLVGYKKLRWC